MARFRESELALKVRGGHSTEETPLVSRPLSCLTIHEHQNGVGLDIPRLAHPLKQIKQSLQLIYRLPQRFLLGLSGVITSFR